MILRASWVSLYVTKAGVRLQRASQLQVDYIKVSWESLWVQCLESGPRESGSVGVERVVHEQVTRLFSGGETPGSFKYFAFRTLQNQVEGSKTRFNHRPWYQELYVTQDAKARLQASSQRLEIPRVLSQRQQGVEKEDLGMLETVGLSLKAAS